MKTRSAEWEGIGGGVIAGRYLLLMPRINGISVADLMA